MILALRILAILGGVLGTVRLAGAPAEDWARFFALGEAWTRGDLTVAIDGVTSPMFPMLLGAFIRFIAPGMAGTIVAVQIVTFALYLFALACFAWFWHCAREGYAAAAIEEPSVPDRLPTWGFEATGYLLFIGATVPLMQSATVVPDLAAAAMLYLAGALLVRINSFVHGWQMMGALGVVLGLAYWSAAAALPVGIATMGMLGLMLERSHRPPRIGWPAVVTFSLVSGSWLWMLSARFKRFTYTEMYDAPPQDLVRNGIAMIGDLVLRQQGILVGVALVIGVFLWKGYQRPFSTAGWVIAIIALGGLAMQSALSPDVRTLGPYALLLWAGLLFCVRFAPNPHNEPWLRAASWGLTSALALSLLLHL